MNEVGLEESDRNSQMNFMTAGASLTPPQQTGVSWRLRPADEAKGHRRFILRSCSLSWSTG